MSFHMVLGDEREGVNDDGPQKMDRAVPVRRLAEQLLAVPSCLGYASLCPSTTWQLYRE
jgi:hypothetical protein